MSDRAAVSVEPDPSQDKMLLLYDYSKHLLSLALLGVGGIVSLTQSPQGHRIPGSIASMMIGFLALSGACSLSSSAAILRARQQDQPIGRSAWISSRAAMLFLGTGVGGFVTIWIKALI